MIQRSQKGDEGRPDARCLLAPSSSSAVFHSSLQTRRKVVESECSPALQIGSLPSEPLREEGGCGGPILQMEKVSFKDRMGVAGVMQPV